MKARPGPAGGVGKDGGEGESKHRRVGGGEGGNVSVGKSSSYLHPRGEKRLQTMETQSQIPQPDQKVA